VHPRSKHPGYAYVQTSDSDLDFIGIVARRLKINNIGSENNTLQKYNIGDIHKILTALLQHESAKKYGKEKKTGSKERLKNEGNGGV